MHTKSVFGRIVRLCSLGALFIFAHNTFGQISAEQIFATIEPSVFQIKIIETKSASQVALGTGFLVGPGLVATNYHVVSNVVLEPQKHRIQIELEQGPLILNVFTVDVVNDLALLKVVGEAPQVQEFTLATTPPKQGSILYSLGNPHNIGMTVIQGNYNGLAEHSFLERIHFSGAVNSGMSGGPTVNAKAEVVGINVASAGNQIGFLVPVKHLHALMAKAQILAVDYDLLGDMASQIALHTDAMVNALLENPWPTETMGSATILGQIVPWMDCWGNSNDNTETGVTDISRGCNNADNLYLSNKLNTGFFEYEYFYKEAPGWPVEAFYRNWMAETSAAVPANRATKRDVQNFKCENHVVRTHTDSPNQTVRRVSFCVRAYKKLPGLYDAFFVGVTNDKERKGIMDHFTLAGVTKKSAAAFLARFIEVLAWQ